MKRLLSACATTWILCCFAHPQSSGKEATLKTTVENLMNVHIGVEGKIPAGWSISVKPVSIDRGEGATVIAQLHIFIHGAPAGTVFEQEVLPVGDDKPVSSMSGISVGNDGILMCAGRSPEQCGDPAKPDDPIEFTTQSLRGEPYRFLFVSPAGTIGIVIVPYPVASRDHGCTLSAVRLTPKFELALITGTGYPPSTDIHYTTKPAGQGEQVVRSDSRGVFRLALVPFAKPNQKSGTLQVKVKEPSCSPEVSYDWGV